MIQLMTIYLTSIIIRAYRYDFIYYGPQYQVELISFSCSGCFTAKSKRVGKLT
jgi:hypothetical protein